MREWSIYVIYLLYHIIMTIVEWFLERFRNNGYTELTIRYRRVSRRQTAETLRPQNKKGR